jgi:hypothetical protein
MPCPPQEFTTAVRNSSCGDPLETILGRKDNPEASTTTSSSPVATDDADGGSDPSAPTTRRSSELLRAGRIMRTSVDINRVDAVMGHYGVSDLAIENWTTPPRRKK